MHQSSDPRNMCNRAHVSWNYCLNNFSEWAFLVTHAVMKTLRNSGILFGGQLNYKMSLTYVKMIPTNAHARATTRVVDTLDFLVLASMFYQILRAKRWNVHVLMHYIHYPFVGKPIICGITCIDALTLGTCAMEPMFHGIVV